MDPVLARFLLEEIGLPVVLQIVKAHQAAGTLATLTTLQVAIDFNNDVKKYTDQGAAWLAANPQTK